LQLTFLGAAGTVTGSKYLLQSDARQVLIDCGLFQGLKRLRERNWQPVAFAPKSLAAIVLTHAHLQEEEAQYANRRRYSKHSPALPLYTATDAQAALELLHPIEVSASVSLAPGVAARLTPAGHVLGAASVLIETDSLRVLFSGDLGRQDDPIMRAPARPPAADWVVIESTYGDRRHAPIDAEAELAAAINRAVERGGVIVVPAFAVGRARLLLHLITRLKARRNIPDLPVFLNSPMATDVTRIYHAHRDEHRLTEAECTAMCTAARFVNSVEESKHLNTLSGPMIVVSASGMATGGCVLHHLKAFAPDPRNLILFTGYQAADTRGAALVGGAETIRIHGESIPVRAEVVQLRSTSSHADCDELVAWLTSAPTRPERIFVTHGEPAAADALRLHARRALPDTEVIVAEQDEMVTSEAASRAARAYEPG
jgi:metallo-beta-lactamase family protein